MLSLIVGNSLLLNKLAQLLGRTNLTNSRGRINDAGLLDEAAFDSASLVNGPTFVLAVVLGTRPPFHQRRSGTTTTILLTLNILFENPPYNKVISGH